jgi:NitT/TauT family transport system substrate-binding protein
MLSRRLFLCTLASGSATVLLGCGAANQNSQGSSPAAAAAAGASQPASKADASSPSAAASASAAVVPTTKRPLDVVKRGNQLGVAFGTALAQMRGYYAEMGIDDQVTIFPSGATMTQAMASGQIEIAVTSITSAFFNAIAHDVYQPWVFDTWHLEKGDHSYMVAVRPDLAAQVTKLSDLKGLKCASGSALRDGGHWYIAQKMFDQAGMKFEDTSWVQLPAADIQVALANKGVDVAWTNEPFLTLGRLKNLLVPWLNLGDYDPGAQIAGITYGTPFIKNRLDVARRWAVAYVHALRDYNDFLKKGKDREAIGQLLSKYTGIPADQVDKAGWAPLHPDGKTNVATIAEAQQLLVSWGKLPKAIPVEQVVDQQFTDYAVQQLGPYQP